jgi:hypothetical protein
MSEHERDGDLAAVDQVVDLLEAYAEARLSPRGAVLARMRRNVMAEAAARAAAETQIEAAIAAAGRRRPWTSFHLPRRVAAIGMAAALTFGTSAAVLAAPPGSPFYNARVALEQAFLPTRTDDRIVAHEQHLGERLTEAMAAADRGDVAALEAALAAYRAEVDAAVGDVGSDPELLAHLEAVLAKHTAVLESLAARLPEQAAIEHALDASRKAASKLHEKGKPKPPGQPSPRVTPNSR